MGSGWRGGALRGCIALGLVALAWSSFQVIRAAGLGAGGQDLERGRALLPGNAAWTQGLGRQALVKGEAARAARLAEEAIAVFPYRGSAWLDLAEAQARLGDREGVLRAAQTASMLGPTKGKWRWRAARLLLQAGWVEEGAAELAAVARIDPSRRREAYDLAWTVFEDPELVVRRIVPRNPASRLDYLHYLMERQRVEPAIELWKVVKRAARPEQRLTFIDFLLSRGVVEEAWVAWREAFPEARIGTIYDGAFRQPATGHGFGWRLGGTEEAVARIGAAPESGEPALEVSFTGGNPDFDRGYQIVRVEEGVAYRLLAGVRWREVTSASPPHLYVRGFAGCSGLERESRGFAGSGEESVTLDFATPAGCQAVAVGLERRSTRKLDRNIAGRVWVTSVELVAGPGKEAACGAGSGKDAKRGDRARRLLGVGRAWEREQRFRAERGGDGSRCEREDA